MKYTFVILSNQPFDQEMATNKWHIATRLALRGHDVVFVDPPLRFKALKEFFKKPSLNLMKLFFRTEEKKEHLTVYKPANIFNFWPFSLWNTYIHSKKINEILGSFENQKQKRIMWVYHFDFPDLRRFLDKIKYDMLIYDVVDEYTAFPEYSERKKVNPGIISNIQWFDDEMKIRINQSGKQGVEWVLYQEEWLAKHADVMFASAPGLVTKFEKWREDVPYLPNGVAIDLFDIPRQTLDEPDDLKNIAHPRIGFTGAIDAYKNNIPLIEKCAKKYPDYQFIMIGPEKLTDPDLDLTTLKSLENVHFLGKKPWVETPSYFNNFDAYFIPYNLNDYTIKGCFPVKYFESLGMGLPTIVTDMPAYGGFDVDGYVSKDDDEFVKNIKKGLDEDSSERIEKRKELARENSWNGKVTKQIFIIDQFFA